MALEIERKFLLRTDDWRAAVESRELLRQGYLSSGSQCSIRARIAGEQAWINLKARRSGMTRLEFEYPIPVADANEILDELSQGPILEKYRHRIPAGEYVWEVDEFLDRADFWLCEIELAHASERPEPPGEIGAVIIREVTDEPGFSNYRLSR